MNNQHEIYSANKIEANNDSGEGIEGKSESKEMKSINFVQTDENDENIEILSMDESVEKQFYQFLKGMRMEKYFDKFKENECCDMDSIELFDDEILLQDIGIKNKIVRKKFLKKCRKIKSEMDHFKDNYQIPPILYDRLAKYGIVTLGILCDEVKKISVLKIKYKITNVHQCDLLWNIIQENENMKQMEGI